MKNVQIAQGMPNSPTLVRLAALTCCVAMPFCSAFAPHAWMPLNLLAYGGVLLLLMSVGYRWDLQKINPSELFLIFVILLGLGSISLAPRLGERTLNHSLAICASVTLFYFLPRFLLFPRISLVEISKFLSISCCLSSVFIVWEFYSGNFLGIRMRDYIPYLEIRMSDYVDHDSTMLGTWLRPRGFAIEAGHMAAFFELSLPISYIYMRSQALALQGAFYTVALVGFLLLGSAAAITALSVALGVAFTWRGTEIRWRLGLLGLLFGAIIFATFSPNLREVAQELVVGKTLGFFGIQGTENFSALDRAQRALLALEIARSFPFGFGWGTASLLSQTGGHEGLDIPFGFISLYAEILVASGFAGALLFLLFLATSIARLTRQRGAESAAVFAASVSLCIHYGTMSNYWHPFLWAALALCNSMGGAISGSAPVRLRPRRADRRQVKLTR
jgi:hypothetical protein